MYVIRTYRSVVLCITFGISRAHVAVRLPCKRGKPINKYRTYLVIFEHENCYEIYEIGKREDIGSRFVRWQLYRRIRCRKINGNIQFQYGFQNRRFRFFLKSPQIYLIVFFIVRKCGHLSVSFPFLLLTPSIHIYTTYATTYFQGRLRLCRGS